MTEQQIELIQLGSLLFLSAYHIILFFQVRRNHYLYLGLFGSVILIRALLVEDGCEFLYQMFPSMSRLMGNKIEAFATFSTLIVAPMFFNDLYRFRSLRWYVRFSQGVGFFFIALVVLVPFEVTRLFHNVFNAAVVGSFILVLMIVYRAIRANMVGAKYIFYGAMICFVFVFFEIIKRSGFAPDFDVPGPNLVNTGVLLLFFFQSIALSAIYASSFRENQRLNLGLEERVSMRTEQLSKSNLIKERFIKIVSHDFRAPMNNLKSMLTLVGSGSISKKDTINLSKKIEVNLNHSLNMLDELLEWTKASSESKVKILKEEVDIKKMMFEAVTFFEDIALAKNISLTFEPEEKTPLVVVADSNSIKVVLRNLINNAVKFTEQNGWIELGVNEAKSDMIAVFVADNGIGVPMKMRDTIFEMDSGNKRAGTDGEKSTGVGLALCKDLVTQNGGKIWLEDNVPNGTVFKFTLNLSV